MNASNVVKRYFSGQTMYWCGWGWSNVSAKVVRYVDLIDAYTQAVTLGPEAQADTMCLGSNQSRVFNCVGNFGR